MTFFKELRRRSRASFRTTDSSNNSNGTVPTTTSSSTLNSSYGASTPPSCVQPNGTLANATAIKSSSDVSAPALPARPAVAPLGSNRNSVIGLASSTSSVIMRSPAATSPLAPRLTSVADNTVVYQKLLLVYGEIGDPQQRPLDGNLTVHHDKGDQAFPCTNWPVSDSYFKALVYLSPGWNQIRLDFTAASLPAREGTHSSFIMLNHLPLNNAPPLHLAIIVGKDSSCTFDAVPERRHREGNGLDIAIRKYRMAAHLWQVFTAEQMHRSKFGRRCFRFDEEWQTGTLSLRDWETGKMKNETKIHVVRSDRTVAQIRDLELAQQYAPAMKKGELFGIAAEAVKKHFRTYPGQKQHVAALFLDSHWDTKVGTIRGHAALGGMSGDLHLAIFGSQALQSYPSCVEEVVPAFTDCAKTDTRFVANDCNESGSSWEAANIGIGAHMHEVGHLFGCPHQQSGVMLRDYVRLNRTFLVREPYSTRTQQQGLRVCRIEDECAWHRLDVLRFRFHPCFRTPHDHPLPLTQDEGIQFYPVGNGKITLSAPTGIAFIEIYPEGGDEICRTWLEYVGSDPRNASMPSKVTLSETDLRSRLPEKKRKGTLKLQVFSGSATSLTIDDFCDVLSSSHLVNLPARRSAPSKDEGRTMNTFNKLTTFPHSLETRQGFKGKKLGHSQMDGSTPQEVILDCTNLQTKLLTSIKVYHGYALDGIEFCYEDKHSQLFGRRGGKPGGDEFFFDTRRGETLTGFYVRAGLWIDGIQVLTSLGRKSDIYGNATGGSGHVLMPPPGYTIAGIAGSCGKWVDGFQLIITR